MDIKYALVSGRIVPYQSDSVVYEEPFNEFSTPMVRYTGANGLHYATGVENFITGDRDDLQAMIEEQERIVNEKVKAALQMPKFSTATPTEKTILEYMVRDDLNPERIDYHDVKSITEWCISQRDHCNDLFEAYSYYMLED